ncbi:hypothetical protein ELH44_37000 [Rhizobium ruizarguesonis]|uniref:fatty acid desaturase family protein n=1 Tax=Rhizobium ruizarguesonis TaxID=2081791 RepID=UPI0010313FBA|nr:fatty acid desaturase [Rhizobium ruizarguesonis]TBB38560.1 hypothetical protein ELH44_37000 [Rhizobium ruizarguesonis]
MWVTEMRRSDNDNSSRQLMKALGRYAKPSNIHGMFRVGINWLSIIAAWVTIENVNLGTPTGNYLISAGLAIFISVQMSGLEACVHEASHYTLFRTRTLNDRLHLLYAIPILVCIKRYRQVHRIHHRELGESTDPVVQLYSDTGVIDFPDHFFWVMFFRPLVGYHTVLFMKEFLVSSAKGRAFAFFSFIYIFSFMSLCGIFGVWRIAVFGFIVPLFYILPMLLFWTEVLDHAGLDWRRQFNASRNNLGPANGIIFYPHGEGYHLIHHLHPGIPAHQLAAAYRDVITADLLPAGTTCFSLGESVEAVRANRARRDFK